ncbi:hypothetical protein GCM10027160_52140 [Streptomyces calidiresistens]|uniref:Protein kilB n=1 Tax=Streptomyces calidiresistens TaxID=1485586 RepID=A0A7W3T6U0_9ACTN|nr:hypothetical protein [Streptomyces calidiresistens]MBB0232022.1 hypothetical protein [Streptomyces calidiresistens]
MWQTLIAVLGTLAGAVTTHLLGARAARRATLRRDQLAAVTSLAAALADHRRAMWVLKAAEVSGAPETRRLEALETTHTTRSAITAPAIAVRVILPAAVDTAARSAIAATYAIRDAADAADLADRRQVALAAAEEFGTAASAYLRRHT